MCKYNTGETAGDILLVSRTIQSIIHLIGVLLRLGTFMHAFAEQIKCESKKKKKQAPEHPNLSVKNI